MRAAFRSMILGRASSLIGSTTRSTVRSLPSATKYGSSAWNVSPRAAWAEAIYRFFYGSYVRHHLFHADPHPGNFLFHEDGSVTFLGRVDGQTCWPPRGQLGFGYDPMFVPAGAVESYGEMGDPFDPQIHEALVHSYQPGLEGPTCVEIYRSGYRYAGRVLRPAQVVVAEPPAPEASADGST